MSIKTIALAVIGTGCVAAAAAGGYLASRQNPADARLVDATEAAAPSTQFVSATPSAPSLSNVDGPAPAAQRPQPSLPAEESSQARQQARDAEPPTLSTASHPPVETARAEAPMQSEPALPSAPPPMPDP